MHFPHTVPLPPYSPAPHAKQFDDPFTGCILPLAHEVQTVSPLKLKYPAWQSIQVVLLCAPTWVEILPGEQYTQEYSEEEEVALRYRPATHG